MNYDIYVESATPDGGLGGDVVMAEFRAANIAHGVGAGLEVTAEASQIVAIVNPLSRSVSSGSGDRAGNGCWAYRLPERALVMGWPTA
mgnify:CR=1 FL=1